MGGSRDTPGSKSGRVLAAIVVGAVVAAVDILWAVMTTLPFNCDTRGETQPAWDAVRYGSALFGIVLSWAVFIFFAAGYRKESGWTALCTLGVAVVWLAAVATSGAIN